MAEEIFIQILLVILAVALIGTLLQGAVWLFRLRRAASIPLLLLLPAKEIFRALLYGIVIPVSIYFLYTQLPFFNGREFNLTSGILPRFIAELCILGILMLWIPGRVIRGYIRRRSNDLDIPTPSLRDENITGWIAIFAILATVAVGVFSPADISSIIKAFGVILAVIIASVAVRYAGTRRSEYGLYYGTIARSLAPIYALSIILMSVTVQPWLLYNEAKWLRKDTILFGYLAKNHNVAVGFTEIEARVTKNYSAALVRALNNTDK